METLTELLKRKLKITWSDSDTDDRIDEIVKNAVPILHFKIGAGGNTDAGLFEKPGPEQNLFLNYCMYEWHNKINEFDANYANELMQIRCRYEAADYEKTK